MVPRTVICNFYAFKTSLPSILVILGMGFLYKKCSLYISTTFSLVIQRVFHNFFVNGPA